MFELKKNITPEHAVIIENAEAMLHDYQITLVDRIKTNHAHLDESDQTRLFYNDPIRKQMINDLVKIKTLCETPCVIRSNQ